MTLALTHHNPSKWFHELAQSTNEIAWSNAFERFHIASVTQRESETLIYCAMQKGYKNWCIEQVQKGILHKPESTPDYQQLKNKTILEIHSWLTSPWWTKNAFLDIGVDDLDMLFQADTKNVSNDEFKHAIHCIHELWERYNIVTAKDIWTWCYFNDKMIPADMYSSMHGPERYTILDHKMPRDRQEVLIGAMLTHPSGDFAWWLVAQSLRERIIHACNVYARCMKCDLPLHHPSTVAHLNDPGSLPKNILPESDPWKTVKQILPLYGMDLNERTPVIDMKKIINMAYHKKDIEALELESELYGT